MSSRISLRLEFLYNLGFLAAAALLLALWVARAQGRSDQVMFVAALAAAVLILVLLANYSLKHWVLRPLVDIARSAEKIAAGEYEERVPEEGPAEIVAVARGLNQLTDQLLQNQARLAENISSLDETNHRLTEAYRELVQAEKMASLGHLSAGIAHEIGNPLGALLGYVTLLKRRGGDGEIFDGLEREARRIDRIVRGLLDYAKPASAVRELVDVNASVNRVVSLLHQQGALQEIDLRLVLTPDLPPIMADPYRIDQVFINLLRNAESAMGGKGNVSIVTRRERYERDRPVPVRRADDPPGINYAHLRRARYDASPTGPDLEPNREVVRIIVADTGPGIPEEHIGSIFDPFFTSKGPGEGTGLGLAIVAGSVADMGGRIEAVSIPGGGATFNLWIPTVNQES